MHVAERNFEEEGEVDSRETEFLEMGEVGARERATALIQPTKGLGFQRRKWHC